MPLNWNKIKTGTLAYTNMCHNTEPGKDSQFIETCLHGIDISCKKINATAQKALEGSVIYPYCSLADFYNLNTIPPV